MYKLKIYFFTIIVFIIITFYFFSFFLITTNDLDYLLSKQYSNIDNNINYIIGDYATEYNNIIKYILKNNNENSLINKLIIVLHLIKSKDFRINDEQLYIIYLEYLYNNNINNKFIIWIYDILNNNFIR